MALFYYLGKIHSMIFKKTIAVLTYWYFTFYNNTFLVVYKFYWNTFQHLTHYNAIKANQDQETRNHFYTIPKKQIFVCKIMLAINSRRKKKELQRSMFLKYSGYFISYQFHRYRHKTHTLCIHTFHVIYAIFCLIA